MPYAWPDGTGNGSANTSGLLSLFKCIVAERTLASLQAISCSTSRWADVRHCCVKDKAPNCSETQSLVLSTSDSSNCLDEKAADPETSLARKSARAASPLVPTAEASVLPIDLKVVVLSDNDVTSPLTLTSPFFSQWSSIFVSLSHTTTTPLVLNASFTPDGTESLALSSALLFALPLFQGLLNL